MLNDFLEYISERYPNAVLILGGNFNYPGIEWSTSSIPSNSSHRHDCLRFLHMAHVHHLTQLVEEPTRGVNILDLLFTTHPGNPLTCVLEKISDHKVVHCFLSLPCVDSAKVVKHLLNYACADTERMNRLFEEFIPRFESDFTTRRTNKNWHLFRDTLKQIEECCVPKLTIICKTNEPWFTRDVKRCLNREKNAFKKATQTNSPEDWLSYKNISMESETSIKKAKDKYFNCTLPNLLKSNPKKFWCVFNPRESPTDSALNNQGDILSIEESAEHLNNHFASVFADELPLNFPMPAQPNILHPFLSIAVT